MGRAVLFAVGLAASLGSACVRPRASGGAEAAAPRTPTRPVDVRAAALPYRVLLARGGAEVAEEAALGELAAARAVCIGEHHPSPHDHWAQLHLIERIAARAAADGAPLGLGLEMFQHPFQGVLDDFAGGRIDEATLLSRTGWADRWGYDFALYRPLIAVALAQGGALLALNTARELTKRVSRNGVAALTESERAELPELVLNDADHRLWWSALMGDDSGHGGAHGHGHGHGASGGHDDDDGDDAGHPAGDGAVDAVPRSERIYTAQVLWDETMAEVAARWLRGDPRRRLVILAGTGHCHESAIVRRLERRGVGDVRSIHPLVDVADGALADLLARPQNDYLFVMAPR